MSERLTIEIDLTDAKMKAAQDRGYQMGLEAAARKAESYADQCCGGSGAGGEGYRNLAAAIRNIDLKTHY